MDPALKPGVTAAPYRLYLTGRRLQHARFALLHFVSNGAILHTSTHMHTIILRQGQGMAEERLYMTAELRSAAGISRTTMDFYLRKGIVTPTTRGDNGYLLFDAGQRERLLRVVEWRRQGYGLREIADFLAQETPS
jgi:hypothetical protein